MIRSVAIEPKTIDPAKFLADRREEQLAQLLASGSNQAGAYQAVYGSRDTSNASRKCRIPRVAARVNWLRTELGQHVVEKIGDATVGITVEAVIQAALSRQYVVDGLMRNIRIAMGEELVEVKKTTKGDDGRPKTVTAKITMRDAGAANRALELLGKEIGMFEGDGAADDNIRDKTEKAPIITTSNERAVNFLKRWTENRTPADILGRKFKKTVGNA